MNRPRYSSIFIIFAVGICIVLAVGINGVRRQKIIFGKVHKSNEEEATPKTVGRNFWKSPSPGYYTTENSEWVKKVRAVVGNVVTSTGIITMGPGCTLPEDRDMFGGVWVDCDEAEHKIRLLTEANLIDEADVDLLLQFRKHGYMVIKKAASDESIEKVNNLIAKAWSNNAKSKLKVHLTAEPAPVALSPAIRKRWLEKRGRVVDGYMVSEDMARLSMTAKLKRMLQLIYTDEPMAFQQLYFEFGSTQAVHQDPAYVVIDERPKTLTASWIACEDIHEDSGPLHYYEGSNRLPDFVYPGGKLHRMAGVGEDSLHESFIKYLTTKSNHLGMPLKKFLAKKGDILVWHSMLAHGGSAVKQNDLTRKSLVTHYCPMSAAPNYFGYLKDTHSSRHKIKNSYFASAKYKKTEL